MPRIQFRRNTAAAAALSNPVLLDGEVGYETDTGEWKIGDGVTAWSALPYQPSPADLAAVLTSLEDKVDALDLDTLVAAEIDDPTSATRAAASATFEQPVAIAPEPSGSDDTAMLQALLDWAKRGPVRLRTGATYKLTGSTGLTLDTAKRGFVGDGTTIDASGMTGGVALSIAGTNNGFASAAHANWQGIDLIGPGKAVPVTGVRLAGASSTAQNTMGVNGSRSVIRDFGVAIEEGAHSWCNTIQGVEIYNCGTAVDSSTATLDAGERFLYVDCNFHNNDLVLNAPLPTIGEHMFIACSWSFNTVLVDVTGPHKVFLTSCHVEYDASPTIPVTMRGSNPIVSVMGGVWIQNSNGGLSTAITAGETVTSITVDKMRVPVTAGDTIVLTDGYGMRETFTASSDVARNGTTIPVNSKTAVNSWVTGTTKVTNPAQLPQYVTTSTAAAENNRGAHFTGVVMSGVVTASGDFAAGGRNAGQAFVHPPLLDGTCYNPNNGQRLTMPANMPAETAVLGALQEVATKFTNPASPHSIDSRIAAVQEFSFTTNSPQTFYITSPDTGRTSELTVVIHNNSSGAMGAISWPGAIAFNGKTWTNPAAGKRRHLVARYVQTAGKWVVTDVAAADY